jgi:ATP/ADP translocase
LIANYNCVTGIVSTLIAHNIINTIPKQVGSFAFALIAPLRTK